ncbi:EGF-like domain protein, partial [Cooperia oncophora]
DHCEERNPCPPEYCNHGGKCSQNGSDFVCNCPPGFYGPQCEHDVNECDLSPCAFGKCVNTMGSYRCECDEGFIGRDCQIYRSGLECSMAGPNICRNGGVCVADEINNTNTCVCPPMYQEPNFLKTHNSGLFCEKDVDECSMANPCENGGTCVNLDGGFECACTAAFEGDFI